jgi:hypothetical protein
MSKIVDEVIAANKQYVSNFGAKKDLALPPARTFAGGNFQFFHVGVEAGNETVNDLGERRPTAIDAPSFGLSVKRLGVGVVCIDQARKHHSPSIGSRLERGRWLQALAPAARSNRALEDFSSSAPTAPARRANWTSRRDGRRCNTLRSKRRSDPVPPLRPISGFRGRRPSHDPGSALCRQVRLSPGSDHFGVDLYPKARATGVHQEALAGLADASFLPMDYVPAP